MILLFLLVFMSSTALYADDAYKLPPGAQSGQCEPVYTDTSEFAEFVICVYKTPDSGYLVLKKLLDRPPGNEIVYILPIPKPTQRSYYMGSVNCYFDGKWLQGLFAEVWGRYDGKRIETEVVNAWHIDLENITINEIDKNRVKCLPKR